MAVAPVGFSWVNYTSTNVVSKDEEDISIIKSHAMRVVHQEHPKRGRKKPISHSKSQTILPSPKKGSAASLDPLDDPFLYRPETDWEGVAICQFKEDFVYPELQSPDIAFQYLNFLPRLCNKYSDRSSLTEAITAVALARFANQYRASDLSFRARKAYANALTLVNKSMKDPLLRKSDHVLATLCLLTKYEIVTGDAAMWQSHERGQAALICQRGEEQLKTEVGASLFRLIYIRQQLNCIAQGQKPAMGMSSYCWSLAFPTPHLRGLMELIAEIANLCCDANAPMHLGHKPPTTSKEVCRIAEDAVKLDRDMTSFIDGLHQHMRYESVINDTHSPQDFKKGYLPKSINIFRNLQHASFWHVFWYGRLHVLQNLLRHSSYQLAFEPGELRTRLQETVNDICESVPYALSDTECPKVFITSKGGRAVAAHYLIWVLAAASTVPGLPGAQKAWISDRLKNIGFVHGIRQALVFA